MERDDSCECTQQPWHWPLLKAHFRFLWIIFFFFLCQSSGLSPCRGRDSIKSVPDVKNEMLLLVWGGEQEHSTSRTFLHSVCISWLPTVCKALTEQAPRTAQWQGGPRPWPYELMCQGERCSSCRHIGGSWQPWWCGDGAQGLPRRGRWSVLWPTTVLETASVKTFGAYAP